MRVLLILLLWCVAGLVSADSWLPPGKETYVSPDGNVRVVVMPRGIESPLKFFEDKVADKQKAGQAAGASDHAMAEIQVRDGKTWRTTRSFPLVNDVGPVNVLVSNEAHRIVTFDNWHSVGFGPDVVVIYDGEGHRIRSMGLKDLLPGAWVRHLPRSVSSIWWGQEHAIDPAGKVLTLQIVQPDEGAHTQATTVPLRISAEDGSVMEQDSVTWTAAIQRVEKLEERRRTDWAMVREARAKPLPMPAGNDPKAWRKYIVELRERLSDYGNDKAYCGITLLQEDGEFTDADSVSLQIHQMADPMFKEADQCVFASPKTDKLSAVLAQALSENAPDSMQGDTIAFVVTPEDHALIEPAAQRTGVTLQFIDATVAYPGKTEAEAVPDWFDGPTQ